MPVFIVTVVSYQNEYAGSKNVGPVLNGDDLPCQILYVKVKNVVMTLF